MKNKTVITKDIYLECNDIVFKYYYNTLLIIYEVLLAIFVIVLFALKDYIFALIFFGVLIAVPFLLNKFLKGKSVKRIESIFTEDFNLEYEYTFNEKDFIVKICKNELTKEISYEYRNLIRVVEKSNRVYIFIHKSSAFALDKNGFSYDDKHNFRSFLKSKVTKYEVIE